jgi:hypothetical protein
MTDIIARELGAHTVMFSFATSDEDYHAPNEFFRLSSLDEGLSAWVTLLRLLGRQSADAYAGHRAYTGNNRTDKELRGPLDSRSSPGQKP